MPAIVLFLFPREKNSFHPISLKEINSQNFLPFPQGNIRLSYLGC